MVGFTLLSALLTVATAGQFPTSTAAAPGNERDIIVKGELIKPDVMKQELAKSGQNGD